MMIVREPAEHRIGLPDCNEAGTTQLILLAIEDITPQGDPAQGRIRDVRSKKSA
ncbi:MAG: hypothetical protein NTZ39_11725 [Methanoregula sp.]|nr:hypothetical protein [Methanoregula sp.]